jgi:hypothetical protein
MAAVRPAGTFSSLETGETALSSSGALSASLATAPGLRRVSRSPLATPG